MICKPVISNVDLAKQVKEKLNLSSMKESVNWVDTILREISFELSQEHEVSLRRFGTLITVRKRRSYLQKNDKTPGKTVHFHISSALKKELNFADRIHEEVVESLSGIPNTSMPVIDGQRQETVDVPIG